VRGPGGIRRPRKKVGCSLSRIFTLLNVGNFRQEQYKKKSLVLKTLKANIDARKKKCSNSGWGETEEKSRQDFDVYSPQSDFLRKVNIN
jgi:hypothetical protein